MNNKENTLEKKGIEFCNNILYPKMGWNIIERITDKERQEIMGDVILSIGGKKYNIDEKTASYLHEDMIIEIMQDAITNNMGWFSKLKKCDGLIYMYFNNSDVVIVYKVNLKKLRELLTDIKNWEKGKLKSSTGGWGYTINLCYPWKHLINDEIVKIIYKQEHKMSMEDMDKIYPQYAPHSEIPFEVNK